jgi:formimidoylglutamate deiminase
VLYQAAVDGGSAAAGLPLGGLTVGQRADFCVVDAQSPALAGIPPQHALSALVFSSPEARMARVCVGGRDVPLDLPAAAYGAAMQALWA